MRSWKLSVLVTVLTVAGVAPPAGATSWTFKTIPASGEISGAPGETIGWGYEIMNKDATRWLVLIGVSADSFANGTGDASVFDFPEVAPGGTVTVPFDYSIPIPQGLFAITWGVGALAGSMDSGEFKVTAEWRTEDPIAGGSLFEDAGTKYAAYTATVTAVPEPSTGLLMLSVTALATLALGRRTVA